MATTTIWGGWPRRWCTHHPASVAATTTTSRLVVIVVVDFSRVYDRLDYDYRTDYDYDYGIFVVDSRQLQVDYSRLFITI